MAQSNVEIAYVDRPEVSETFADSVENSGFSNGLWRFEFGVTRKSDPKGPTRKYPACRLVLSLQAGIDLVNQLQSLKDAMERDGLLKSSKAAKPA
jgi:hypothetical protein